MPNCTRPATSTGPITGPNTSADSRVRRSRRFSRNSLRNTAQMPRRFTASPRAGLAAVHQRDEGVFEPVAAARADIGERAGRHHLATGDHHDLVAELLDFLHDMAGKQHAVSGVAQLRQQLAQAAHRHDVEPVGGFVEQQVLRPMHQRARQRGLELLALRKALRAAGRRTAASRAVRSARRRALPRSARDMPCSSPK